MVGAFFAANEFIGRVAFLPIAAHEIGCADGSVGVDDDDAVKLRFFDEPVAEVGASHVAGAFHVAAAGQGVDGAVGLDRLATGRGIVGHHHLEVERHGLFCPQLFALSGQVAHEVYTNIVIVRNEERNHGEWVRKELFAEERNASIGRRRYNKLP